MKLALSMFALSLFAFGCGSSNSGPKGTPWCDSNYKVSTFGVTGFSSKTAINDDAVLDLTEGDYALTQLDVFFKDLNRDIRSHVAYAFNAEGVVTSKVIKCVGSDSAQINPDMKPYTYNIEVFSKMNIDASGKTNLGLGLASITFEDNGPDEAFIKAHFDLDEAPPAEKNLKDSFKNEYSEREQVLYGFDNAYELQNKLTGTGIVVETRQIWRK